MDHSFLHYNSTCKSLLTQMIKASQGKGCMPTILKTLPKHAPNKFNGTLNEGCNHAQRFQELGKCIKCEPPVSKQSTCDHSKPRLLYAQGLCHSCYIIKNRKKRQFNLLIK